MVHYHVHIRNDPPPHSREWGALTLTREAADLECQIERSSKDAPQRTAHIENCNRDCFGSRAR